MPNYIIWQSFECGSIGINLDAILDLKDHKGNWDSRWADRITATLWNFEYTFLLKEPLSKHSCILLSLSTWMLPDTGGDLGSDTGEIFNAR
jgi:hypothetical protein